MISEREKLEYESLPEFVREPRGSNRESYATASKPIPQIEDSERSLARSAELEILWPGVGQDFIQSSRRSPSLYLTIGFLAGAVVSLAAVAGYSMISNTMAGTPESEEARILVAQGKSPSKGSGSHAVPGGAAIRSADPEVIVPTTHTYEVKEGDTLAAIALAAYNRVTPRLLEEICRANGMTNANVLSLGQRLILPEYRPQRAVASAGASQ